MESERRRALLENGEIDYSKQYLTIVSLEDNNTIGWKCSTTQSSAKRMIYVSTDNGATWVYRDSSSSGTTLATLNEGDKLFIKYDGYTSYGGSSYSNRFTSTGYFNVEGNIMSLVVNEEYADFTTSTNLYDSYTFRGLFNLCSKLKNAKNLILPATTLASYCYQNMFSSCTSLISAPELPATTLADHCYYDMFNGCTSLTSAPALPATTLASYCYQSMFNNCTSLTFAPELPATTLANGCYSSMFSSCTSLTTAPVLKAATLMTECYSYMLRNCSSLNYIKALFTTTPGYPNTYYWVEGVASTGTFVKNSSATWSVTGVSGVPSGWTVETASE